MTTPTRPAMTDYRTLLLKLHTAIQLYTGQNPAAAEIPSNQLVRQLMDAMAATAAALAQPEPVGPTDEELYDYWVSTSPEFGCADPVGFARAVLARWGHQPAPPADGEVGELVEFLRIYGDEVMDEYGDVGEHDQLTRAAELLERQAAPVPVPVSERLPGAGDCLGRPTEDSDAGWCWTYSGALEVWRFQSVVFPRPYPEPPRVILSPSVTHWLPANALPLPQGEVEE